MTHDQAVEQTIERALPYLINDADEHSTPSHTAYERYIDPDKRDMAIRVDRKMRGIQVMSYNGRPARFTFENYQVVGSNDQLAEVGVQDLGAAGISCATAELAAAGNTGMRVELDRVPLREASMTPEEILGSESQERMMAVVEPERLADFLAV